MDILSVNNTVPRAAGRVNAQTAPIASPGYPVLTHTHTHTHTHAHTHTRVCVELCACKRATGQRLSSLLSLARARTHTHTTAQRFIVVN